MRKIRQEIHCHECDRYVQFEIDMDLDGNHVFNCPKCGHEHCRVVKNGEITEERWDRRNRNTYTIRVSSWSSTSNPYYTDGTGGSYYTGITTSSFLRDSWNSAGTDTGGYYW